MTASGGALKLQLLRSEAVGQRPSGILIDERVVSAFAIRMSHRAGHYNSLRVLQFSNFLVLWSLEEETPLPWVDDRDAGRHLHYLTHLNKVLFFPMGFRPNISQKWVEPLADGLVREKGISQPVLLLPGQGEEGYVCVGMGEDSVPAGAVDWNALI